MNNASVNLETGIESAWTSFMHFLPNLLLFLVVLVVGYYVSKLLARLVNRLLGKANFNYRMERGSVGRAMARSKWRASDVVGAVVFWTLFLFTLDLAFSVFGPNPISTIITGIVAYLPRLFVGILIAAVAVAVASIVKEVLQATLGGLSYGKLVANLVSIAILAVGIFAALNELQIAPAIVNGLFYALLAVFVGSAVISIGVGGIAPMRGQWEKLLGAVQQEAPKIRAQVTRGAQSGSEESEQKTELVGKPVPDHEHEHEPTTPRFPTQP
jgi:MFS family permease